MVSVTVRGDRGHCSCSLEGAPLVGQSLPDLFISVICRDLVSPAAMGSENQPLWLCAPHFTLTTERPSETYWLRTNLQPTC